MARRNPPRMSRLSLPYAAQDLAQHRVPDPSPAVSIVMVMAVVAAAVTPPFDEPQHLLRAAEESPDLADVHARLAFFSTTFDKRPYEAPREKFRPQPLVFLAVGKRVRIRLQFTWTEYVDRGGVWQHRSILRVCSDGWPLCPHLNPRRFKGSQRGEAPESRFIPKEGEA